MGAIDFTPTQNHELRKTFEDHGIDYEEEVNKDVRGTVNQDGKPDTSGRISIDQVTAFVHYEDSSTEYNLIKYHEDLQSSNVKYLLMWGKEANTKRVEDFDKAISWLDRILP